MKNKIFLICLSMLFFACAENKCSCSRNGHIIFVSPEGSDANPGTLNKPLASLKKAKQLVHEIRGKSYGPVTVYLRSGTYYLTETLRFTPQDGGAAGAPVIWTAYDKEEPIISGARPLSLSWTVYKEGIYQAKLPTEFKEYVPDFDGLVVNGQLQHMARYPNFPGHYAYQDEAISENTLSPKRTLRWKNPMGGRVHEPHNWGSMHSWIAGVNGKGHVKLEIKEQINRNRVKNRGKHCLVENIFEELDAPGEWYYSCDEGILYFMPTHNVKLEKACIEAVITKQLIVVQGYRGDPVHYLIFKGLTFTQTARTVMEDYELLLRGDWGIVRKGALVFEGAEDCRIQDCTFRQLGGNGIFLNKYNRCVAVEGCVFEAIGESAVCLVGDVAAVRSPAFGRAPFRPYEQIDTEPGPRSFDYPARCRIHNNLMHHLGLVFKQVAGVFVSMSEEITVSHNSIYNVPRAGICINDGCWGGHIIEYNDIFDTVRETGDHGPFNSWGRDRFWQESDHRGENLHPFMARQMALLDCWKTVVIRYNRFSHKGRHSHGIDLDDGSTNYHVYKNLCLGMSWKTREGFFRVVENNIGVGPYYVRKNVCFKNNGDVIRRNIVVITRGETNVIGGHKFKPSEVKEMDHNLYYCMGKEPTIVVDKQAVDTAPDVSDQIFYFRAYQKAGFEPHSIVADPLFMNPEQGDYRVKPDSPAIKLGFENFPMNQFGVIKPELQEIAAKTYAEYDRLRRKESAHE